MMGTSISAEQLKKAESLYYNELREEEDTIKKYTSKYNEDVEYALSSLGSLKNKLRETLLELLLKADENELEKVIDKYKEKIKRLDLFALLEISHRKFVEIKFKIGSPLFFQKLHKDYRELMQEFKEIQEKLSQTSGEKEIETTKLKLENLVERLRNFDFELEEERRTGTYNFIGKIFVWSIPILIGIYQLIAMQYFLINPFTPLVIYVIVIAVVYLILKTNYIKIILSGLKTKKDYFVAAFYWFIALLFIFLIINSAIQDRNKIGAGLLVATILFLIISVLKSSYDKNKQTFIQRELEPLKKLFQEL